MNVEFTMYLGAVILLTSSITFTIFSVFFAEYPSSKIWPALTLVLMIIGAILMISGLANYTQCRSTTVMAIIDDNTVELLGQECRYKENFGEKYGEWINQHTYESD